MEKLIKRILITGGTSGIGKATAIELARRGERVIITARDRDKGLQVVEQIKQITNNPHVELVVCDLSSQRSVWEAAHDIHTRFRSIHVLINCAGIVTDKRKLSVDGLELMFATNHVGPFLLTILLTDKLKAGKPSRIINVAAPSSTRPVFTDLQGAKKFSPFRAWAATKACNLLFTYALQRRLQHENITVNAFHPGIVKTNLTQGGSLPIRIVGKVLNTTIGISPQKAAKHLADLALEKRFSTFHGKLVHNGKVWKNAPFHDDRKTQERLWTETQKLLKKF